jgi:hypothetical protein
VALGLGASPLQDQMWNQQEERAVQFLATQFRCPNADWFLMG